MKARSGFVLLFMLVAARAVVACVDGVTPDCSVESVCAPIVGDAAPIVTGDAGAKPDAKTSDASDAATDGG